MEEKGILSLDAFFASVVAIIIIGMLANLTLERMNAAENIGNLGRARMILEEFANGIDIAYTNGPGFAINITLELLKSNSGANIQYELDVVGKNALLKTGINGVNHSITAPVLCNETKIQGIPISVNNATILMIKNNGTYENPLINIIRI
ncbi:MAG: hypothetical protein ACE5K4_11760 [Candidatus Hydrothermarchaeota archaeon]